MHHFFGEWDNFFSTYLLSEVGVAGTVTGVEAADLRDAAAFKRPIFIRIGPIAVLRMDAASSCEIKLEIKSLK